ncbi:MAG TPA: GlsB/YeaQ/YmgE family stress response membrane protein [Candidatus Sulfotelmatobacter sp.]|nr:GlsB/YeaQ/YmgE family stress response membrane protein [Candidatus Sulfotelmatobacter sp.]
MGILLWIIFGAIAGWLASTLTESRHGMIVDIILGILGAFVGGIIMNFFGQSGVTGFNLYSIFVAVIGSIALIFIGRIF